MPGADADTVVHDAGWDTDDAGWDTDDADGDTDDADGDTNVTVAYLHLPQHAADHAAALAIDLQHSDVVHAGGDRSGANGSVGHPSGNGLTRQNGIAREMVTVP